MDSGLALLANPSKVADEPRPRAGQGGPGSVPGSSDSGLGEYGAGGSEPDSASDGPADTEDSGDDAAPEPAEPAEALLSPGAARQAKFRMLHDMDEWERRGNRLPRRHTMSSPFEEVQSDYEYVKRAKASKNAVRVQKQILVTAVNVIEMANNAVDPFGVDLDGWGDYFGSNIDDFDDVLAELHDKYRSRVAVAPEIRLLMMMGMSIMAFKQQKAAAAPEFEEVIGSDPALAKAYAAAASSCAARKMRSAGHAMGPAGGVVAGLFRGMMGQGQPPAEPAPPDQGGGAPPAQGAPRMSGPGSRAREVIDFLESRNAAAPPAGMKAALSASITSLGPASLQRPAAAPAAFSPPPPALDTRAPPAPRLPAVPDDLIEVMSASTISAASGASKRGARGVTLKL